MKVDREKLANAAAYIDMLDEQQLTDLDLSEFFDPAIQYNNMSYEDWILGNSSMPPAQFLIHNVDLWRR